MRNYCGRLINENSAYTWLYSLVRADNRMVIWSLFDGSGIMGLPWAEYGHTEYCFNSSSGNHGEYVGRKEHPLVHHIDVWIDYQFIDRVERMYIPGPDIIFAFPDCTELAVSGAKHEGHTSLVSVENAQMIEAIADFYGAKWMVENPVSKMSTHWRKPDYYFHPYQYGGYMTGKEESHHPKMPARDGYTKKTCIWAGNGFVMPEPLPVEHIGKFWGWTYLGGKSERTKQLRSLTPRGFARAVFLANRGRLIK